MNTWAETYDLKSIIFGDEFNSFNSKLTIAKFKDQYVLSFLPTLKQSEKDIYAIMDQDVERDGDQHVEP